MTDDQGVLGLTVTLPAIEVAQLRRRVRFLEAVLVQQLRDERRIKEWFAAAELVRLRLPGLPTASASVTRLARSQRWMMREVPCRGGKRLVYHFSSLPDRAFQALIDLVVRNPPPPDADGQASALPVPPPIASERTAPAWLLPLMRIIRGGASSISDALKSLPRHLPAGVSCPSEVEARKVLHQLGLTG